MAPLNHAITDPTDLSRPTITAARANAVAPLIEAGNVHLPVSLALFLVEPPSAAMTALGVSMQEMREIAARPGPCLRHEDIHGDHGAECFGAYVSWWAADRRHLKGQSARDAYALEVEQRILNRLVREHAPAHRINPALSK